eukprot:scaffold71234_cov82-Cyclotella_meneghiniana.AAC.3
MDKHLSSVSSGNTRQLAFQLVVRGVDLGTNMPKVEVFDKLLSSIDQDYVRNVLLHELHVTYDNFIVPFASSSLSSICDTASNYATKPLAECAAQDVIEAAESLCGKYLSSITAC